LVLTLRAIKDRCCITFGRGITTVRALGVAASKLRETNADDYRGVTVPKFVGVRRADDTVMVRRVLQPPCHTNTHK
jgi:hypothetical protein